MKTKNLIGLLLAGRFLSTLADQFLLFAIPLIIYRITGSAAMSGLAFAIEWAPRVISLPLAGVLSDKLGSRRVFLTADAARALICGIAYFLLQFLPQAQAFGVLAVMSGLVAFFYAQGFIALEAALPRILPSDDLPRAQSIFQGIEQVSGIGGPLLAAALVVWVPAEFLVAVAGMMFATSFLSNFSLPNLGTEEARPAQTRILEDFKLAFRHVKELPGLMTLIGYTIIVNLMYASARALSAPLTSGTFAKGDEYYGLLHSLSGVVTLVFLFAIPYLTRRMALSRLGLISFVALALSSFAVGWASGFWGLAIAFAVLHGADAWFNVYIRTERAKVIPKADMGKTIGLIVCLNQLSMPVSGLLIAQLSSRLGSQGLMVAITVGSLLMAVVLWIASVTARVQRRKYEAAGLA